MAEGEAPKIVVDSDWKQQARAEKEKLGAVEKQAAAKKPAATTAAAGGAAAGVPAAGPMGGEAGGEQGMPPADFTTLLGSMVSQALMYMGAFPDPETGKAVVSLEYARFHIDLLEVLDTKTKGNLTAEEAKDMTQALSELRMRFVEISKAVAQMVKERAAQRAGGGGGAGAMGMGGFGAGGIAGPGLRG